MSVDTTFVHCGSASSITHLMWMLYKCRSNRVHPWKRSDSLNNILKQMSRNIMMHCLFECRKRFGFYNTRGENVINVEYRSVL